MGIIGFLDLLRMIYSKKLPDLNKIQGKGLLAVKIAQHFALRVDFLDENVCTHLMQLYGHADTNSDERSKQLLKENCDKNWIDQFTLIDYIPFTAASVGQVHNGILTNGEEVIIKVIKGDFLEAFLHDTARLTKFFKFILIFYPKLERVFDPIGVLNFISNYTKNELNLINEIIGQNILKTVVEKHKDEYDFSKFKFHTIHQELSSERVLVSEKIQGVTLDDLITKGKCDYNLLLELFKIHGFFLFAIGTFHGDIHPGNIMVDSERNLYFIDTSAISKVTDQMRIGLFNLFVELASYNFIDAATKLEAMSEAPLKQKQRDKFTSKFLALYKDFPSSTVQEVSLTKKMMETIKLGVNCGMKFDKGMFAIIKSLMYLDGMVLRVNPEAKLLEDMKVFIDDFKRFM